MSTTHRPQHFLNPTVSEGIAPTLGMVSVRARQAMVERLGKAGILSAVVLNAMKNVERHHFVDSAFASRAYDETALPIGFKQTISQPWIVARMLELASGASKTNQAWLEIGTGCGYQAAVMAQCTQHVCSIERIEGLHDMARRNLSGLEARNISLLHGDGTVSWQTQFTSSHADKQFAGFDAIVVAAAGLGTPQCWLDQLNLGGRLIAPVQDEAGIQRLQMIERQSSTHYARHTLEPVQFVPLKQGISLR